MHRKPPFLPIHSRLIRTPPVPAGAPPRLLVLEHGTVEQLGTLEEPLRARTAIRAFGGIS